MRKFLLALLVSSAYCMLHAQDDFVTRMNEIKMSGEYYTAHNRADTEEVAFEKCVKDKKPLADIIATARKTVDLVDGMPYFKFNKYTFSGFNPNGNWEDVKMHLDAGLKKQ